MKRNIYKKILASLLVAGSINAFSQSFTEDFDNVAGLTGSGWAQDNNSGTIGTNPNWFQGTPVASFGPFDAFNGAANAYVACNFNSTTGINTISNWLMTPNRVFNNGDQIKFYSRTVPTPAYPDRLQVRFSGNGASVNCGTLPTDVGDFTTLLLDINPTLTVAGYPNAWTQYTITISGLSGPTSGRVAFRYFVTGGGPSGSNSDYIGVDNFQYIVPPPPANDLCANAISLSACGTSITAGTTAGATADAGAITCGPTVGSNGVWYTVVGNGSNITADLCTASSYDSRIHIYTGTCGAFSCVAGDDNGCGTAGTVTWPSVAATTYTIFVEGTAAAVGGFTLTLTTVDGAAPIPDAASLPDVTGSCSVTASTTPTATDNCNGSINGTTSDPLTYTTPGTHPITWTYSDLSGNTSTQTQNVVVAADLIPPTITCSNDTAISSDMGICGATVNYQTPSCAFTGPFYDDQGTDLTPTDNGYFITAAFPDYIADDFVVPSGCWTVTNFTAGIWEQGGGMTSLVVNFHSDAGGIPGPIISTQTLTSADWTSTFLASAFGFNISNYSFDLQTPVNICAGTYWLSIYDNLAGSNNVAWSITSGIFGNAAQQSVFGTPTGPWAANGNDFVFSIGGDIPGTVTDNCPTCATVTQTTGLASGSFFPVGTTTNTFVATDGAGNTTTCSFDITIADDQAPTPDAVLTSTFDDGGVSIPILDGATEYDSVLVSGLNPVLANGNISSVCINLTHTFDGDLDMSLISPSGTIINLSDDNGGSGDNYTNTCFDMSASTNVTAGFAPFSGSYVPEGSFDVFSGEDPNGYWKLMIYDDAGGDQGILTNFSMTFAYADMLPTVNAICTATVTAPTGSDNCDGPVTATTSDPLTYSTDGVYSVTWTYSDGAGNTFVQTQSVIVEDTIAPVPNAIILASVTGECTATVSAVPTATDNCTATVTGTTTDPLTYNVAGTYTITWTYNDGRGNTTTQTQTVTVTDTDPPVPAQQILPNVVGNCVVTIPAAPTASDACTGTITATTTDPTTYNLVGTFFIIWHFDDGNGNTWTQNQTVVVNPCLGVEDESGQWNAMIYPNPGSGIFTLSLSEMPVENTEIRLVDALGQVLYAGILQNQVQQFDFSGLASATYYLLITNNNGHLSKPVIIRHNY
jgi:subtilisin-like proprotein convertase family protein